MSDGQYAHIERAHRRLEAALSASTAASPDPHVVDESFLAATTALGELQEAAEEIAQQNRELSQARALLAADRARYQAHFAAAPDAYLVTDGAGVVEDANRAAEALLGRPYRQLLGQPLSAFFRGEHQVAYFRGLATVSEQGTSRWSASLARPAPEPAGGTEAATPVEIIVSGDGAGASLRWLVRDNTVQVEAEDRRREALSRERAIADTLRSLDQMKTDFLLVVTHNLRTPIASILHTTDLLRSGSLDPSGPQWARALEILGDSAEHLQRINTDLLDLERAASGALPAHPGEVDLVELIREVVAITLEGEREVIVPPGPHLARVDQSLVRRIVELLLDNADRYAGDGGPIEVQVACHEDRVRLTVADRGPGVPDAEKEAVFELFRRGDGAQTEGTGIGLHLVRRFAERHGGRAWVEDREGGGACFCVELGAIVPIAGDGAAHLPE